MPVAEASSSDRTVSRTENEVEVHQDASTMVRLADDRGAPELSEAGLLA